MLRGGYRLVNFSTRSVDAPIKHRPQNTRRLRDLEHLVSLPVDFGGEQTSAITG